MSNEKNVERFFAKFDRAKPVQVRVAKMLLKTRSISSEVLDLIKALCDRGTNRENLEGFIPEAEEAPGNGEHEEEERRKREWRGTRFSVDATESVKRSLETDEGETKRYRGLATQDDTASSSIKCFFTHQSGERGEANSNRSVSGKNEESKRAAYEAKSRLPRILIDPGDRRRNLIFFRRVYIPKNKPYYGAAYDRISINDIVIDPSSLYPPLQCELCGFRYVREMADELAQHMEDHRRRNNAISDRFVLRRDFFTSAVHRRTTRLMLSLEGPPELIPAPKKVQRCALCGNIVHTTWSNEIEQWILEDATVVNDEEYVHKKCAA